MRRLLDALETAFWLVVFGLGGLLLVIVWTLGLLYMLSWFFTLWWGI